MRRLLFPSALKLTLTLALLVGAALLVGLRQPPSAWASLLKLDDCALPCWIGIEPGLTLLGDAERRIGAAFPDGAVYGYKRYALGTYEITHRLTGNRIDVGLIVENSGGDREQSIVYMVNLVLHAPTPADRLRIGEVFHVLGDVEGVQRITGVEGPRLDVFFRNQQVEVFFAEPDCDRVRVEQPIRSIFLADRPPGDARSWLSPPSRWLGFSRCHNLEYRVYPFR